MEIVKATNSLKAQTNKTYMRDQAFADLKRALEDALTFERGDRQDLKTTRIEGSHQLKVPVKIKRSHKR